MKKVLILAAVGLVVYKFVLAKTGRAAFFSTKFGWTRPTATQVRQSDTAITAYGG